MVTKKLEYRVKYAVTEPYIDIEPKLVAKFNLGKDAGKIFLDEVVSMMDF